MRVPWMLGACLLAGCGLIDLGEENRPKILLETEQLRTRYMVDRDEIVRQTASAVLRCRATLLDAPLGIRTRCSALDKARVGWEKYDLVIRNALIYDTTLRASDWERALEASETYRTTASDVMSQK